MMIMINRIWKYTFCFVKDMIYKRKTSAAMILATLTEWAYDLHWDLSQGHGQPLGHSHRNPLWPPDGRYTVYAGELCTTMQHFKRGCLVARCLNIIAFVNKFPLILLCAFSGIQDYRGLATNVYNGVYKIYLNRGLFIGRANIITGGRYTNTSTAAKIICFEMRNLCQL